MSISDNVASGLRLTRTPRKEIGVKVREALIGAGLWEEVKDRLDKSRRQLSPAANSNASALRGRSRLTPRCC